MKQKTGKGKRPADHNLWGDRNGKKGTLPRKERWPKGWPAKRKFEGKWYTLEYAERYREDAEMRAQASREGAFDSETGWATYYARVVPAPVLDARDFPAYLVYLRPKPLPPDTRAYNRKNQQTPGQSTWWDRVDRMYPSALPKRLRGDR